MKFDVVVILSVYGTISHLGELVCQCGCVTSVDFLTAQGKHHFGLHGVIGFFLFFRKGHFHLIDDAFWHSQMVNGLHGNGDVGDLMVDGILRSGKRLIGEHHLAVSLVWLEVAVSVMGDEASQSLAHVQQAELRPKIHETVGGRCASETNHPFYGRTDLEETSEPLCLVGLEGRKFVDDYHIVVKGQATFFHQPLDVFSVDDVQEHSLLESSFAFCFGANGYGVGQPIEVIPFLDLRRPCISGDTQRCDDQHLADGEVIQAQIEDGGQRDDAFAQTHVQEYSGDGMLQYEVGGISLVIMRLVFHG